MGLYCCQKRAKKVEKLKTLLKMERKWGMITKKTANNGSKYRRSLDERLKKMYYL